MLAEESRISLRSVKSFFVGGELVQISGLETQSRVRVPGEPPESVNMDGDHVVGQMYVTRYSQVHPITALPVLLWHGGGLTGACWEGTPDGRSGWLECFLRAGFDVVVSDAFERGRASSPPYPQYFRSAPEYRSLDAIWYHFRLGPEGSYPVGAMASACRDAAYPGQQFPVEDLAQFGSQFVARWTDTDAMTLKAYGALLRAVGPCIVIGHSQGAYYALACARRHPDLVRGVVALEPPAVPEAASAAGIKAPPGEHLFIWGDFIHGMTPHWEHYFSNVRAYHEALGRSGARSEFVELPERGIHGNSHMMIMDRNSAEIAALVQSWIIDGCSEGRLSL